MGNPDIRITLADRLGECGRELLNRFGHSSAVELGQHTVFQKRFHPRIALLLWEETRNETRGGSGMLNCHKE